MYTEIIAITRSTDRMLTSKRYNLSSFFCAMAFDWYAESIIGNIFVISYVRKRELQNTASSMDDCMQ
ncbi:hypothetical protein SDC9_197666 [bioreactor metagenome]|uniref:Uncharacterized protein n=1 Tax=bioreactor metagenome TaxID=1076179 RepID=A0A645IFE2_9ZZZZ